MRPTRIFSAALVLSLCGAALAQQQPAKVSKSERFDKTLALGAGGTFVIENPFGNIDVIGADVPNVSVVAVKNVIASDNDGIEEGRKQTALVFGGDEKTCVLRTVLPRTRTGNWTSTVNWLVRVPSTVHVRVNSGASQRVRVANIRGNVFVKNVNGLVVLQNVGASTVESVNGNILFDAPKPSANATLSTVNGSVHVVVNPDANFSWQAETLTGDVRSTLPVRGSFSGSTFQGRVNAPGGPTITATAMMGSVFLLRRGTQPPQAVSLRESSDSIVPAGVGVAGPSRPTLKQETIVQGRFRYSTNIGDVRVREIRGDAVISTGAGFVELGTVIGKANVTSLGGPLQLGEIFGPLQASTRAGDILVDAAREGGVITTDGGIIRLLYNGGPTTLFSGGGDIVVRQAAGPVNAETRSGDITITIDPSARSQRVDAKTAKGNIILNVSPRFGADIDATILTTDPNSNAIRSDLSGLTIQREQIGGKTRIRATGKIGGGGERITLLAEDGGIQINSRSTTPMTVIKPR